VLSLQLGAGADTLNHTRAFREARVEAAKAEAVERVEAGEADAEPDTTGLRFSLQRISPDGSRMLLQSSRGWWIGDFRAGGGRRAGRRAGAWRGSGYGGDRDLRPSPDLRPPRDHRGARPPFPRNRTRIFVRF
jgi:hypothetical protein